MAGVANPDMHDVMLTAVSARNSRISVNNALELRFVWFFF